MDTEAKKSVLRKFCYGLYLVTAAAGEEMDGAAISWLSQVSFEPPLVMLAVRKDSHIRSVIEQSRGLAINLLSSNQREVASAFFRPTKVEGDRMAGYRFEKGPETGSPLLTDLPGWVEGRVLHSTTPGDHTLIVVEVVSAGVRDQGAKPMELSGTDWTYAG